MTGEKISDNEKAGEGKKGWAKKLIVPVLTLLFVIAVSVGLFFYARNPDRIAELQSYGYLGAFLVSLIGNATILMPVTTLPVLCAIGVLMYPATGIIGPVLVGLAGGAGAGIGETTGYMLGYSGRGVISNQKLYLRVVEWMKRWGALAIFVNAALPLFFDVAGMAAGALRFPLWKFVLLCWLGRSINYIISVVVVAVWGWKAFGEGFSITSPVVVVVLAALAALVLLALALFIERWAWKRGR